MTESRCCSEADQDRLLLAIYALAPAFARGAVQDCDIDDVVHDIALDCLIKLRTGRLVIPPEHLQAVVRKMVRDAARNWQRRGTRRNRRDGEHLRELVESCRPWMSPDVSARETQLDAFQRRTLERLPQRWQTAFAMVRDERAKYEVVAKRLGVSKSTIHKYITGVQREFRKELASVEVTSPQSVNGGRLRGGRRARKRLQHRKRVESESASLQGVG